MVPFVIRVPQISDVGRWGWRSRRSRNASRRNVLRRGASMPRWNHRHANGSTAELPRFSTVRHVQVDTSLSYGRARIEDPVRSVVGRNSRDPDTRSHRQDRRIGGNDAFRDRDARRSDPTGAVRSRRKPQWSRGTCRSLRCGCLRRRLLRWRELRRRRLRRRGLGRRRRVNSMGARGHGQQQ